MFTVLLSILLLLTATPLWAMGQAPLSFQQNSTLVGQSVIDIALPRLSGTPSNFTQAREGKKAIVMFWATWCPHCHDALAQIHRQQAAIEAKNIKILLVDVGESKEEVAAYFKRYGYTFDSFLDEENALQEPYQIIGVPTMIYIDDKGVITNVMHELPENF